MRLRAERRGCGLGAGRLSSVILLASRTSYIGGYGVAAGLQTAPCNRGSKRQGYVKAVKDKRTRRGDRGGIERSHVQASASKLAAFIEPTASRSVAIHPQARARLDLPSSWRKRMRRWKEKDWTDLQTA